LGFVWLQSCDFTLESFNLGLSACFLSHIFFALYFFLFLPCIFGENPLFLPCIFDNSIFLALWHRFRLVFLAKMPVFCLVFFFALYFWQKYAIFALHFWLKCIILGVYFLREHFFQGRNHAGHLLKAEN